MAAFLGVVLLGVLPGIGLASRVVDPQRVPAFVVAIPGGARQGRGAGRGSTTSRAIRTPSACRGCVLFRFDAPLFFANSRTFRDQIRRLARSDPPPRWIVVAAEPITDVDTTAADMLEDLDEALERGGDQPGVRGDEGPGRQKVERYELTRTIAPEHFYPTIEAAVEAFRATIGAEWAARGRRRSMSASVHRFLDAGADGSRPSCRSSTLLAAVGTGGASRPLRAWTAC